jgi:hypothetical protein
MPASVAAAAWSNGTSSVIGRSSLAGDTVFWAYPPWRPTPMFFCLMTPLLPSLIALIATRSPTETSWTPSPIAETTPAASCPRMIGVKPRTPCSVPSMKLTSV